jgi:hypothetical protein
VAVKIIKFGYPLMRKKSTIGIGTVATWNRVWIRDLLSGIWTVAQIRLEKKEGVPVDESTLGVVMNDCDEASVGELDFFSTCQFVSVNHTTSTKIYNWVFFLILSDVFYSD